MNNKFALAVGAASFWGVASFSGRDSTKDTAEDATLSGQEKCTFEIVFFDQIRERPKNR